MTASHARIEYQQFNGIAPAVGAALRALGQAVDDSGLEKVRASQLNGCAFCVHAPPAPVAAAVPA